MFSEIGENEKKVDGQPEEKETVEVGEISNLLRSVTISWDISKELNQVGEGDNMDKQRIDAIKIEQSTIADDPEDLIDKNEIEFQNLNVKLGKLQSSNKLQKTSQWVEDFVWSKLWGVIWKRQREAVVINERLHQKGK